MIINNQLILYHAITSIEIDKSNKIKKIWGIFYSKIHPNYPIYEAVSFSDSYINQKSNIKAEKNYISVLHNIFLALGTDKSLFLSGIH